MNRTRPLHNFDLPELRWGKQRFLRCINLPSSDADSGGIDAVREKLILDLRAAAESMKLSIRESPTVSPAASPASTRPWNLRTRRAACRAPEKTERRREEREKREKVRFAVGLSRAEIEHDFKAMAGVRPPRRPKKRSKTVQRELDQLFPGLWLTEITPETYKVDDVAE